MLGNDTHLELERNRAATPPATPICPASAGRASWEGRSRQLNDLNAERDQALEDQHARRTRDRHLSDMSIWDTHRSWNPLTNLLQPDIGLAFARSLVRMIKQGGDLPRWPLASGYTGCMIGGRVFPVCTPLSAVYP